MTMTFRDCESGDTLRERVRERLMVIIHENRYMEWKAADAILREFRLQPVAVGVVNSDTGEVGMSRCNKGGARYPSAPLGTVHKCGQCSGGMCERETSG